MNIGAFCRDGKRTCAEFRLYQSLLDPIRAEGAATLWLFYFYDANVLRGIFCAMRLCIARLRFRSRGPALHSNGGTMKQYLKIATATIVGVTMAGCMAQVQGIQVDASSAMSNDRALAYLNSLETSYNAPAHAVGAPQCQYSENGISGSRVVFLLVGSSSQRQPGVAFDQWRVDEIRKVQGMGGTFYSVFVKSSDGAKCAPLRSKAGTTDADVMPKIKETVSALVSLGVRYEPNRLGASR